MLFKLNGVMDTVKTSLFSKVFFRINTILVFPELDFIKGTVCDINRD